MAIEGGGGGGGGVTNPIRKATLSGQIISVNQLESSMAGFIAQLKGKLTTQRYWYTTVFVANIHGMPTSTYNRPSPVPRPSKQSTSSSAWSRTWASAFITIMLTMVDSQIKASSKIARCSVKGSPIEKSMPTSKMALRRRRSVTFRNRHGQ